MIGSQASRPTARPRRAIVVSDSLPACLAELASTGRTLEVHHPEADADIELPRDGNIIIVDGRVHNAIGVVRSARLGAASLPIFFLAQSLDDVAAAVAAGANDFALESAPAAEIMLRCRLLANGWVRPVSRTRNVAGLRLDRRARTLSDGAHTASLSPIELKMLERLLLNPGQPVSKSELRRSIWHHDELAAHPTNIAVVYVSYLRKKLAPFPSRCRIRTVTHAGYALDLLHANGE